MDYTHKQALDDLLGQIRAMKERADKFFRDADAEEPGGTEADQHLRVFCVLKELERLGRAFADRANTEVRHDATCSRWREMGSEPKDGSHFLAYVSEYEIHSASWYCGKLCGAPGPYGYPSGIGRNRVKYWMPIPAIPANANARLADLTKNI